jgi:hypothetical protein
MGFDAYAITNGETAAQTWGDTYAKLTALSSKPIVITETATIAPNQPFWLSGAENVLATQYPNIKGVMYFDTSGARADWSLIPTGTPSGLGVFRTFANTPYLAGQTPASAHGAP